MVSVRNLLIGLFFATAGALVISLYFKLPLDLTLVGVAGLAVSLYLAVRFPEWFLVAALFAPQWKAMRGFASLGSAVDLTLAMLLCLSAGLAWRILLRVGQGRYPDVRTIFAGQFGQILAFAAFAAIVSASYFYTTTRGYGLFKLERFLLIGTMLLIAPFFIIFTEEDFRRFVRIFVGFAAITAIQLIGNLETRAQDVDTDITRIGAGWLVGMAIVLVLFYPLVRNKKAQRTLMVALLALFCAGLMASAARGPIVALTVAVVVGMLTLLKQGQLKMRTALFLAVFLVVGVAAAYIALKSTDTIKFTEKAGEMAQLVTQGTASGTAAKRMDFYRVTLAAIPRHPLFGTGVGSWAKFYYGTDQRNYPHNMVLEIAFEEGLVGLAVYFVLLSLVALAIFRMLRDSRWHFLVLGLMVSYCVMVSMFSGDLDDNRLLWLWIGVTLSICRFVKLRIAAVKMARQPVRGAAYPQRVPAFSRQFVPNR